MMSGVPGPPPGGGENIKSKIMLDIKSELKTEYKPPTISNGTIHSGNMEQTIKVEPLQTTNRPIQPAIRPSVPRILVQGQVRQVHPPNSSLMGATTQIRPAPPATLGTTVVQPQTGPASLSAEDLSTVQKCKNFLMTLIQLAQRNEQTNPSTVHNVKGLVQKLIDNSIDAEEFTERLQTELQSSPQPYLVPFLRKSLPLLRRSMCQTQTPTQTVTTTPRPVVQTPTRPTLPVHRISVPGQPVPGTVTTPVPQTPPNRGVRAISKTPLPPSGVPRINIRNVSTPVQIPRPLQRGPQVRPIPPGHMRGGPPSKIPSISGGNHAEERDEDITDVAQMANVDLMYESKNLATSSEIGTKIRDAPQGDKAVSINEPVLHKLVGQAASRSGGIDRVTPDGARLIGLALEEYIKNLVSKAIHAGSHRTIQFKESEHRERISDIKNQFKYVHEIMMVERAHAEEAEQEQRAKLLRSRNKKEDDPEKEKKKKDAKMKQQALQEAEQQKQADETALEASRRKPRNAAQAASSVSTGSNSRSARICRVKIRDVLFCLETEKLDRNSHDELFKRYLK